VGGKSECRAGGRAVRWEKEDGKKEWSVGKREEVSEHVKCMGTYLGMCGLGTRLKKSLGPS